jgi:hypothetical protein
VNENELDTVYEFNKETDSGSETARFFFIFVATKANHFVKDQQHEDLSQWSALHRVRFFAIRCCCYSVLSYSKVSQIDFLVIFLLKY